MYETSRRRTRPVRNVSSFPPSFLAHANFSRIPNSRLPSRSGSEAGERAIDRSIGGEVSPCGAPLVRPGAPVVALPSTSYSRSPIDKVRASITNGLHRSSFRGRSPSFGESVARTPKDACPRLHSDDSEPVGRANLCGDVTKHTDLFLIAPVERLHTCLSSCPKCVFRLFPTLTKGTSS